MNTPTAPFALSPVVVCVLDALPDPPETFTAANVLDALGRCQSPADAASALDVSDVLDALLSAEMASCTLATLPTRYVVHPEARPF